MVVLECYQQDEAYTQMSDNGNSSNASELLYMNDPNIQFKRLIKVGHQLCTYCWVLMQTVFSNPMAGGEGE